MIRLDRSQHSATNSLVATFIALSLAVALSACGGSDSVSASISNVTINPRPSYPDIETTVSFEITDTDVSSSELSWSVNFGDGTTQTGDGAEAEAIHTYQNPSDYPVELRARHDGSTIASRSLTLDVRSRVDLTVSNVQPRPSNVEPGDALTVSFDLQNNATTENGDIISALDVPVFITRNQTVSLEALQNDTEAVTQIGSGTLSPNDQGIVVAAGRTRAASVQLTVPEGITGGQWRVVPWVRSEGQFGDPQPADNYSVSENPVIVDAEGSERADLAVTSVYAIPDFAFPALNRFTHGFNLENLGGAAAPEVEARTYLSVGDQQLDDSDPQVATTERTYDVPAGGTVAVGPNQIVLDSDITAEMGDKQVYVIVEGVIGAEVDDANADNNIGVGEPPITVSDQRAEGKDIAVNSFDVTPTSTFLDGTLQIQGEIANEGQDDIENSFVCPVYLGEQPRVRRTQDQTFSQINIPALDSQETVTFDETVTIPALFDPGTYYLYIVCNPNGVINETYRANNQNIFPEPVEVSDQADVDLFANTLDVPETTSEGETTTLTANVCVTGSNPSGATQAGLYRNAGTSVDFSGEPVRTFEIDNIPPDECRDVQIEVESSCANFQSTYSYGIAVDITESLPENNEENNQTSGSNPVEVQGEYCSCDPDQYEPNDSRGNWASVETGSTSASLCDPGGCDFFQVTDVQAGSSLIVESTFDPEVGPLQTSLFDSSGLTQLDSDSTPGRQQVATFNVPSESDYTFKVCGASPQARNLYSLNVRKLPQPNGVDLIPRRPTLPAQSEFVIGESLSFDTRIHNIGTAASGDFNAEIIVTPDKTVGDSNDVLMDPSSINIESIGSASARDVTIDAALPTGISAGTYYIAIHLDPSGSLSEADASNNIAISNAIEVQTRCYDPLEPNDTIQTARQIQSGTYNNLTACASGDDVYEICVDNGKQFTLTTNFDDDDGDIDVQLKDAQFNTIDSSSNSNVDTEEVSENYVNGDQCYYARVSLRTTQQELETTYSMSLDVQTLPPDQQCDSSFEPNGSFSTASPLLSAFSDPNASDPMTIDRCPQQDAEYYKVSLTQGQQVSFKGILDPASQPGNLRLQLYNPGEVPLRSQQTTPGDSTVSISNFVAPQSGTYYLQATLTGTPRKMTYRLEGSGFGGIDLSAAQLDFWSGTYNPGSNLFFDVDVSNLRSSTATSPKLEIYFSTQSSFSTSNATLLDTFTLNDLGGTTTRGIAKQSTLPNSIQSGTAYIHARVLPSSGQTDANLNNNIDTRTIQIGSP